MLLGMVGASRSQPLLLGLLHLLGGGSVGHAFVILMRGTRLLLII